MDLLESEPYIGVVDGVERLWLMIPTGSPDPVLKTGWNPVLGQHWVKAFQPDGDGWRLIGMTTF